MTEGAAMKYKLDDYKVGEIAKFYGVSVDTVRFYDRKGVLKPEKKSDNNYRTYNKEEFISMDYIMRLRSLGISIENIKKWLPTYHWKNPWKWSAKQSVKLKRRSDSWKIKGG